MNANPAATRTWSQPQKRRLVLVACAVGALAVLGVVGLFLWPWGPQLVLPPGPVNEVTVQLPAKQHQSWVHGSYNMCLDEPGEVEVTSVEFESGSAEITRWALRPGPEEGEEFAGDVRGTLATRGIENTEVLTRVCDGQRSFYELVLQLRAGESSTEGDGVVVEYTSDGRDGSLALPDRVVLCVRPERPDCT
jgi:hypothetical protein